MIDALCVGAHPDDVEIGMGGIVAGLVRRGRRVVIVDLTDGEPTPVGSADVRRAEAARAATALGVEDRRILPLANRQLADGPESRRVLAQIVRELRPRIMFGPFEYDAHPDHIAAAHICRAARFQAKLTKTDMAGEPYYTPRVYSYFAMHLRTPATPSLVVDVADDLRRKTEALACYESQFGAETANAGALDAVAAEAAYWGRMIGREAGEPLHAPETVAVGSVEELL